MAYRGVIKKDKLQVDLPRDMPDGTVFEIRPTEADGDDNSQALRDLLKGSDDSFEIYIDYLEEKHR